MSCAAGAASLFFHQRRRPAFQCQRVRDGQRFRADISVKSISGAAAIMVLRTAQLGLLCWNLSFMQWSS